MDINRYSRQTMLSDFGILGQQKLFNSSVLVIGVGGLGCPVLEVLISSGVGKIGIVDFDIIETDNLHRQFLFDENDIGQSKVITAKKNLNKRNSETEIEVFNLKITAKNCIAIIEKFEVVVDCTDNFSTRYLINDACFLAKKPLVYGSIFRYEGQASVFNVEKDGFSTQYRDLFPVPPKSDEVPSCNEAGVLPSHSAMTGTILANEVIKIIIGSEDILANQLLVFNSLTYQTMMMKFKENQQKNGPKTFEELQNFNYDEFCSIDNSDEINSVSDLESFLIQENSVLIDVRELDEQPRISLFGTIEIPLNALKKNFEVLKSYEHLCFICASGIRSRKALELVKKQFPEKVIKHFSLGIKTL